MTIIHLLTVIKNFFRNFFFPKIQNFFFCETTYYIFFEKMSEPASIAMTLMREMMETIVPRRKPFHLAHLNVPELRNRYIQYRNDNYDELRLRRIAEWMRKSPERDGKLTHGQLFANNIEEFSAYLVQREKSMQRLGLYDEDNGKSIEQRFEEYRQSRFSSEFLNFLTFGFNIRNGSAFFSPQRRIYIVNRDPRDSKDERKRLCEYEQFCGLGSSMAGFHPDLVFMRACTSEIEELDDGTSEIKELDDIPMQMFPDFSADTTLCILQCMFVYGLIFNPQELESAHSQLVSLGFVQVVDRNMSQLFPSMENIFCDGNDYFN